MRLEIKELDDFINFMNTTKEGQKIDVFLLSNGSLDASKEEFKGIELAKYPDKADVKKGFLAFLFT